VALDFVAENPETLILTTADSEAAGMQVYPMKVPDPSGVAETPLPDTTRNGGALDGRAGTGTPAFHKQAGSGGGGVAFRNCLGVNLAGA